MKLDFGALPARLGKGLQKLFGSANQRMVAAYAAMVKETNALEPWAKGLDQAAIQARVKTLTTAMPSI